MIALLCVNDWIVMTAKERYPYSVSRCDFTNGSAIWSIWTSNEKGIAGLIGIGITEKEAWKNADHTILKHCK